MRGTVTLAAMALLISSGVMSGCSLTSRPATASQPASSAAETKTAVIDPGVYKFRAVVRNVRILELDTQDKIINGIANVAGERCVFTGNDPCWAIQLDVRGVDKPLWFLKSGEPVTFVVHSPAHVFGKSGPETVGEVYQFSLTIRREENGLLDFGPLTTPDGVFAKEGGFVPQK